MTSTEVWKAVFPFLDGKGLASCMQVCKQLREIARDDYYWKCVCAKRWPSMCRNPIASNLTYYELYQTFHKRTRRRILLPPRLSFDDLEFYLDIWAEGRLLFSEVIPGPVLQTGIRTHPPGTCHILRYHLEGPDYKLTVLVDPGFTIQSSDIVSVSLFVGRKDTNKIARIVNKSLFDYIDRTSYRALAYDYLEFSPVYPFISGIRGWISLLFLDSGDDTVVNVFGIAIDFCDAANSEDEVLWLLDMLDWK